MAQLIKFPNQREQHDFIIASDYKYRKYDWHSHVVKQMKMRENSPIYTTTCIDRIGFTLYKTGSHYGETNGTSIPVPPDCA